VQHEAVSSRMFAAAQLQSFAFKLSQMHDEAASSSSNQEQQHFKVEAQPSTRTRCYTKQRKQCFKQKSMRESSVNVRTKQSKASLKMFQLQQFEQCTSNVLQSSTVANVLVAQ
jgi:hypothetical protein